ncbi:methyltransferase domain-containing protein [Candidatus Omnitrophota bacterium]
MDLIDEIKKFLKRSPIIYDLALKIISPVCPLYRDYKILFRQLPGNARILNIGSGPKGLSGANIVNIDLRKYRNVNIVGDAASLPFSSSSFDGIVTIATLEHVRNITKVMSEIERVLRPTGLIYAVVPFMAGYHSSPFDYRRWTTEGVRDLFKRFEALKIGVAAGPTSAFLCIFQEWLAMVFSFNIKILYQILLIAFMILTFPLKFLDLLLSKYSFAKNISYTFYFFGEKRR